MLFDRINFDPKIQIRYIDTKHQLADIVTKGNTRNFSLMSCSTMAKRIQEQKEEERVVSKSRLAEMNRTDGQTMEFEWKIFPGFIHCSDNPQ